MWRLTLVVLSLAVGAWAFGTARATEKRARFPVIGCDDPRYPYANHYEWSYAPSGYCGIKRRNGLEGIDHTRWQSWGRKRATGRGFIVVYDQAVLEFPATMTAYGFWSTKNFAGTNEYVSTYTKLHLHVLA